MTALDAAAEVIRSLMASDEELPLAAALRDACEQRHADNPTDGGTFDGRAASPGKPSDAARAVSRLEAPRRGEAFEQRHRHGEPLCIRGGCPNVASDENARCKACRDEEGE